MFFDALTMAAVADELREAILGGFVQRVLRLSEHALGFEIYAHRQRHWLLLSAHPQHARVHLAEEKLARGIEGETPLLLLLRKHVRESHLIGVDQPPSERVLVLSFEKRLGAGTEQTKVIIETMGRYSNVILVDAAGIVLDALKRVPAQVNRYRVVLPHHPYVPPPPQAKNQADRLTPTMLGSILHDFPPDKPVWQGMVGAVAGVSPLLAREVTFRAMGQPDVAIGTLTEDAIGTLLDVMKNLIGERPWRPSVGLTSPPGPLSTSLERWDDARGSSSSGATEAAAYAPYELRHLDGFARAASISAAINAYYADVERHTPLGQLKAKIELRIEEERERRGRRCHALERELEHGQAAERLRQSGEAILAAVAAVRPGQSTLAVNGETIALDPHVSAVENAQAYFRDYKKAKAALAQLPALLAEEKAVLAYLDEVSTQLELASSREETQRVAEDLAAGPFVSAPRSQKTSQKKSEKKMRRGQQVRKTKRAVPAATTIMGYDVYAGRSARDNEELTFHVASPDDLWLHARGVPGAHVIVKARGQRVLPEAIEAAARLAAGLSKARDSKRVAVDYTLRKHVRHARAGLPGLVTYQDEQTIFVTPNSLLKQARLKER